MQLHPEDKEHKFLHDISNPLSIVYGGIKLITMKLEQNPNAMTIQEILDRLNKSVFHIERMTTLLSARRDELREEEKTTP